MRHHQPAGGSDGEDLLVPIHRAGTLVYEPPSATEARAHAHAQLEQLEPGVRRLHEPHAYLVGLDRAVAMRQRELAARARAAITVDALD